jgi:hypothetical protein
MRGHEAEGSPDSGAVAPDAGRARRRSAGKRLASIPFSCSGAEGGALLALRSPRMVSSAGWSRAIALGLRQPHARQGISMKPGTLRLGLAASLAGTLALGLHAQTPANDFRDLARLARKYGTDKGPGGHNFAEVYDLFFAPMRSDASKVLEIGIAGGASLQMFRDYFPKATIYGIDIQDAAGLASTRIRTFVANQEERSQLARFIAAHGSGFDLILDDGAHTMPGQQISLGFLFQHVKPGGLYVVEDVHTSLLEGWKIDPDRLNTTLAMIEGFVRSGSIASKHMTGEEARYLEAHIADSTLYRGAFRINTETRKGRVNSLTWILRKK